MYLDDVGIFMAIRVWMTWHPTWISILQIAPFHLSYFIMATIKNKKATEAGQGRKRLHRRKLFLHKLGWLRLHRREQQFWRQKGLQLKREKH